MPQVNGPAYFIDRSFAARRIAAGQSIVQVAAMFSAPTSVILDLLEDDEFKVLVETYSRFKAKSEQEKSAWRRDLILDAIDGLIEKRDAEMLRILADQKDFLDEPELPRAELHNLSAVPTPDWLQDYYEAFLETGGPIPDLYGHGFDDEDDDDVDDDDMNNVIPFPGGPLVHGGGSYDDHYYEDDPYADLDGDEGDEDER